MALPRNLLVRMMKEIERKEVGRVKEKEEKERLEDEDEEKEEEDLGKIKKTPMRIYGI